MQERKSKKYRVFVYLFTMFLVVSTIFLPCRSFAGEMEILLDKLVSKGVLTKSEAESIAKEMKETKEAEKGKMEGETAKTGAKEIGSPEWVKNLPDWIVNPPDWIKNMKFSGDLRLRYDMLEREPLESSTAPDIARNRGRFRLRLGAETQILDDVKVGFGLASGNGNPRSANQTFDSEFLKKPITIDYAFAEYTPIKWLSISAGKLKTNPIFRDSSLGFPTSGLIWDPDITPEGVAVGLNYPALLKLDVVSLDVFMNNAFFILDEFSTGREPYMFVVQPGFNLKIMKDINLKTAVAYYQFFGIKNKPLLGNQPSPGNTNTLFTSGPLKGNYQFNYDAFVASGELGYMTPFPDMVPYVGVFGEFIRNLNATHDEGWTGGARVGSPSLAKFGDWQLAYAYRRLERDAWPDIFPDDDFYQGQTNAKGHYLWGAFGLAKNISTAVTYYHTANILGEKQPEDRLFVDLQLKF
ncbi:MAG: putative porin [Thermodesulfobacteriota bacterium]